MKTIILTIAAALAVVLATNSLAQTNLNFNAVSATSETAIILSWNSRSNEVYALDYATELFDDGGTIWNTLYEDYPSHGTNTFIADAGNYNTQPGVLHPKNAPMRFYRVRLVQNNDSASNPTVAIASVTNGASLSGDVTIEVVASSSEILSEIKLYIDGEEQWGGGGNGGTNHFTINTCEYPNGPHKLFATAKSQSGFEGAANGGVITYGRAVSSYVDVTFDNLITRFDFFEPFFEPDLGQTQRVSAAFVVGCDWILEIQNSALSTVRYVAGSGSSMQFDWDGTGTNGAALPNGVYSYLLTAQTNGQVYLSPASTNDVPDDPPQLFAMALDGYSSAVPLFLYPPGMDTNDMLVFETTFAEMAPERITLSSPSKQSYAMESQGVSAAASQSTRGPKRKPRIGVKGEVGSFGICYKTYGTNGFTSDHPLTGWPFPLQTRVAIDEQTPNAQTVDYRIAYFKTMADDFTEVMTKGGWKSKFVKADSQWGAADIKKSSLGGNAIFNTCNFGILMTHGSYANNNNQGNSSDGVKYTYCWLGGNDYVKLSDMDFGSPGTNGLRWMTIFACNLLRSANYNSMNNAHKIPVNDDLHLLLGFSTVGYANPNLGRYYAENLLDTNNVSVLNALREACGLAYNERPEGKTNILKVAASGWSSCWNDSLTSYNDPDLGGLQYNEYIVFTPP